MVLLDIGSTLIEGPSVGPVRRLVKCFGLAPEVAKALDLFLFQTQLEGPDGLGTFLSERCGVDAATAAVSAAELWNAQIEEAWVLDGAAEAVQRLQDEGIERAYISNIWSPFYQGFERLFPQEARKKPSFLSFRMGMSKPDPAFYRAALGHLRVEPEQTVMVGDTYENDIAPAQAIGIKTVWVLHRPAKEVKDLVRIMNGIVPAPNLTLESIADLSPGALQELVECTPSPSGLGKVLL